MPATTLSTPPCPHRQHRRWPRSIGAFGMTAALLVGGSGALLDRCESDPPTQRERVVQITNQRRAENGRSRLAIDSRLMRAAQKHSEYQARNRTMTHTGSGGSSAGDRMRAEGYRWSWWGENVAAGQNDAASVMQAWMNSSGHRANILNSNFVHIGVGMSRASNGVEYWTMVLGKPY